MVLIIRIFYFVVLKSTVSYEKIKLYLKLVFNIVPDIVLILTYVSKYFLFKFLFSYFFQNEIFDHKFPTGTGWYTHSAELGKMYFVGKSR